jgi:hypothetical protein
MAGTLDNSRRPSDVSQANQHVSGHQTTDGTYALLQRDRPWDKTKAVNLGVKHQDGTLAHVHLGTEQKPDGTQHYGTREQSQGFAKRAVGQGHAFVQSSQGHVAHQVTQKLGVLGGVSRDERSDVGHHSERYFVGALASHPNQVHFVAISTLSLSAVPQPKKTMDLTLAWEFTPAGEQCKSGQVRVSSGKTKQTVDIKRHATHVVLANVPLNKKVTLDVSWKVNGLTVTQSLSCNFPETMRSVRMVFSPDKNNLLRADVMWSLRSAQVKNVQLQSTAIDGNGAFNVPEGQSSVRARELAPKLSVPMSLQFYIGQVQSTAMWQFDVPAVEALVLGLPNLNPVAEHYQLQAGMMTHTMMMPHVSQLGSSLPVPFSHSKDLHTFAQSSQVHPAVVDASHAQSYVHGFIRGALMSTPSMLPVLFQSHLASGFTPIHTTRLHTGNVDHTHHGHTSITEHVKQWAGHIHYPTISAEYKGARHTTLSGDSHSVSAQQYRRTSQQEIASIHQYQNKSAVYSDGAAMGGLSSSTGASSGSVSAGSAISEVNGTKNKIMGSNLIKIC